MGSDLIKSSLFYADQRLCSAEILPPPQVRARIEVAVLNFLKALSSTTPAISNLPMISRRSDNCGLRSGLFSDVPSIFLSYNFCRRSLMRANDAKAFVRVWKVMQMCFLILGEGKLVTQRELFYKLICDSPEYFTSQSQVNRTLQDVISLLRCSRQSLGVMASSRGAIIGRLVLQEPGEEGIDCSTLGPAGHAITGDLNLLSKVVFNSDARYIIIVEKDGIFQRLAEDHLFNQIPCILITAKGYPDMATRFILHRLTQTFPEMPIFGLVDW
ncbi:meiotic recombination protein SPO11-2 isoform X2 [Ananas comosus]|nr:meiotic recombination protein SPO11-2 isoform X2 [Ananas comosus]